MPTLLSVECVQQVGGCELCTEAVRYLLSVCRDRANVVNLSTARGRTCLHIAALTNNVQLLRYLLADLNANRKLTITLKVRTTTFTLCPQYSLHRPYLVQI